MSDRDSIRVEYVALEGGDRIIYPDGEVVLKPEGLEGVAVKAYLDPPPESGGIADELDRRYVVIPWDRVVEIEYKPSGFEASRIRRQQRGKS